MEVGSPGCAALPQWRILLCDIPTEARLSASTLLCCNAVFNLSLPIRSAPSHSQHSGVGSFAGFSRKVGFER